LNQKYIFLLCLIFFNNISANIFNDKTNITAERIEYNQNSNEVSFSNNVQISSNILSITASTAIYNNESNLFSIKGLPSIIKSNNSKRAFNGEADEILLFSDEKVHLIGNANIKIDNISVSSKLIIFNPITGKIFSN
jgi:lipopolysaccharide export system protein LptA|tara:strand:+ start:26295 stop:26705 length:411 start_codon:yes stop_codon:yes gene_type:complete